MGQTHIFNRRAPQVQEDAKDLLLPEFLKKYEGNASELVLTNVWNEAQKGEKTNTHIRRRTDLATNLTPVAGFTSEDGSKVDISVDKATKVKVVEVDNVKDILKKGKKVGKGETLPDADSVQGEEEDNATAQNPQKKTIAPEGKPARATRVRELIAVHGKTMDAKPKVIAALREEGYDCKTIHSEWNRLAK